MAAATGKRPWFQFSLRTLTLGILILGILLGWYVSRARRQRELFQEIYRSNSSAYYDYQIVDDEYDPTRESWAPQWLHEQPGTDFIHPVVKVHLWEDIQGGRADSSQVDGFCRRLDAFPRLNFLHLEVATDERLVSIGSARQLRRLEIASGWEVTDRGVAALGDLSNLRQLDLSHVPVSKEGLHVIGRLTRLEVLTLGGENLCDETLAYLTSLERLKELRVEHDLARVTDAGLRRLAELCRLEVLHLRGTMISDEGLAHLVKLSKLRELELGISRSRVTERGLYHLAALSQLERLDLDGVLATDDGLMPLAGLPNLVELRVTGPNLRDGQALERAMPGCKVHVSKLSAGVAY